MKPFRDWSTLSQMAAAVGALLLLGGVLEGLQRLAGPVERSEQRAARNIEPAALRVPEVLRENERTVRVLFGNQKTGFGVGDSATADALETCLREGLEQAFRDAEEAGRPITTARRDRGRGRGMVREVADRCLGIPRVTPPQQPARPGR